MNYYNEFDPKAAAWLRELIRAGEIPEGFVDERSIVDVRPHDLAGYVQCHFFAGIGGWFYALKLAGWPESRPVWTASLPCQPFSSSGQQRGVEDERHLWPVFFDLVRQCSPDHIFGEQVARAIGFNWLDGISADLEGAGYTVGQAVLGAHSVGSPHKRQRLYWMGHSSNFSRHSIGNDKDASERPDESIGIRSSFGVTLGDAKCPGLEGFSGNGDGRNKPRRIVAAENGSTSKAGSVVQLADMQSSRRQNDMESGQEALFSGINESGPTSRVAHARHDERCAEQGNELRERDSGIREPGAWSNYDLLYCRDDKFRRVEAGTFPLAHGIPGRVGLLRGYGNAIVPQVAAEFIGAYLDIEGEI